MSTQLCLPNVTDSDLADVVRDHPDLVDLDIRGSAVTDAGLVHLGRSKIRRLHLKGGGIGDEGLRLLAELPDLEVLVLEGTGFGEEDTRPLRPLRPLQRLFHMSGCQVTDAGLAVIRQFPRLERLDLRDNRIGDEGLRQLTGHPTLRWVCVDGAKDVTAA